MAYSKTQYEGRSKSEQRDALELSRMLLASQRRRLFRDEWVCHKCTKRSFLDGSTCRVCGKERDDSDRLVLYSEAWQHGKLPGHAQQLADKHPHWSPLPSGAAREADSVGSGGEPWHHESIYKDWADGRFDDDFVTPDDDKLKKADARGVSFPHPLAHLGKKEVAIAIFITTMVAVLLQFAFDFVLSPSSPLWSSFELLTCCSILPVIFVRQFIMSPKPTSGTRVDEVVARAENFPSKALALYSELRALPLPDFAEALKQSKHSAQVMYSALMSVAGRTKKPEFVMELFDDMQRVGVAPTLRLYENAMRLLAGMHSFKLALDVYEKLELDGLQPSRVTRGYLVNFAAEVGDLDLAAQYFEKLSTETVPNAREYMLALRVLGKLQDWPRSLAVYRDCQARCCVDPMILNLTLATGVAAKEMSTVKALLEEASDISSPTVVDVVSFNTLLKGHAHSGEVHEAIAVLGRMAKFGLTANLITYNTAIYAAVRYTHRHGSEPGAADHVWHLYGAMRAGGVRPDRITCTALVKGVAFFTELQLLLVLDALEEVGESVSRMDVAVQSVMDRVTALEAEYYTAADVDDALQRYPSVARLLDADVIRRLHEAQPARAVELIEDIGNKGGSVQNPSAFIVTGLNKYPHRRSSQTLPRVESPVGGGGRLADILESGETVASYDWAQGQEWTGEGHGEHWGKFNSQWPQHACPKNPELAVVVERAQKLMTRYSKRAKATVAEGSA